MCILLYTYICVYIYIYIYMYHIVYTMCYIRKLKYICLHHAFDLIKLRLCSLYTLRHGFQHSAHKAVIYGTSRLFFWGCREEEKGRKGCQTRQFVFMIYSVHIDPVRLEGWSWVASVAGFQTGSGRTFFLQKATNPLHFVICCLSAHFLPQIPYILPHSAIVCHESWLWEIAALLWRPRLSWPRLEAVPSVQRASFRIGLATASPRPQNPHNQKSPVQRKLGTSPSSTFRGKGYLVKSKYAPRSTPHPHIPRVLLRGWGWHGRQGPYHCVM